MMKRTLLALPLLFLGCQKAEDHTVSVEQMRGERELAQELARVKDKLALIEEELEARAAAPQASPQPVAASAAGSSSPGGAGAVASTGSYAGGGSPTGFVPSPPYPAYQQTSTPWLSPQAPVQSSGYYSSYVVPQPIYGTVYPSSYGYGYASPGQPGWMEYLFGGNSLFSGIGNWFGGAPSYSYYGGGYPTYGWSPYGSTPWRSYNRTPWLGYGLSGLGGLGLGWLGSNLWNSGYGYQQPNYTITINQPSNGGGSGSSSSSGNTVSSSQQNFLRLARDAALFSQSNPQQLSGSVPITNVQRVAVTNPQAAGAYTAGNTLVLATPKASGPGVKAYQQGVRAAARAGAFNGTAVPAPVNLNPQAAQAYNRAVQAAATGQAPAYVNGGVLAGSERIKQQYAAWQAAQRAQNAAAFSGVPLRQGGGVPANASAAGYRVPRNQQAARAAAAASFQPNTPVYSGFKPQNVAKYQNRAIAAQQRAAGASQFRAPQQQQQQQFRVPRNQQAAQAYNRAVQAAAKAQSGGQVKMSPAAVKAYLRAQQKANR